MDYKDISEFENYIQINEVKNFELAHIFDCGQCFRWVRQANGNYIGVAYNKVIEVEKRDNNVIIYNTTKDDFNNLWENYFDLKRDYTNIKDAFQKDELLKKSVEFGHGIRLLQQEPFEITISFIISSNNRIPMIKRAIENISRNWGEKLTYKDETYYAFPSLEALNAVTEEQFAECGVGFRAKYIKDTVTKLYNATVSEEASDHDLNKIKLLEDEECHKTMQQFSGVGPKVADCIILFSMGKYSAFPVDVWVKRAMQYFYLAPDVSLKKIREFGRNKFGELSGFAQQYLFYYARENNIKVE